MQNIQNVRNQNLQNMQNREVRNMQNIQNETEQDMNVSMENIQNMQNIQCMQSMDDTSSSMADEECIDFGHEHSKLFQILNGVLVVGYDSNSNKTLPPHLCMTFDTLLDLANYQNQQILTKNQLMSWYKQSKNKLIYGQNTEQDIEIFNHRSTQTLFDELSPTQPKSMEMTMDNNRRRRGPRINDEQKQYQLLSESNGNIKTIKDRERKPTRPPMSSKYNAFRMSQQKKQRDPSKQRENNNDDDDDNDINSKSESNATATSS